MNPVEARLAAVEARLAAIESRLAGGGSGAPTPSTGQEPGQEAPDHILNGQWGDTIVIKTDPNDWIDRGGDSFVGCRMSECPSEYLLDLANLFDWQGNQDQKKGKTYKNKKGEVVPTAPLKFSDAGKARGWARRNKDKTSAAQQHPTPHSNGTHSSDADESEIPF